MNRRQFLKVSGLSALGVACGGLSQARAANPKEPVKPRPPGTCGGWTDARGNGRCDHSEKAVKPCNALTCPGHGKNKDRDLPAFKSAPAGTCARWTDPQKKGTCSVSLDRTCLYVVCPAHREHAATGSGAKPA